MEEVKYCFLDGDDRRTLFDEAYAQGFLAAVLDFPKLKTRDEMVAASCDVCDEMKPRVYAVDSFSKLYSLFTSAWASAYAFVAENFTERQMVNLLLDCKGQEEKALTCLRECMSFPVLRLDETYVEILASSCL